MKRKRISKKFSLNKQTVANLDRKSLSGIFGGVYTDPGSTCKFCDTEGPLCQPTADCTGSPCDTYEPACPYTEALTCLPLECTAITNCNC